MDKPVGEIYQVLQRLVGLHRQLLEVVRKEREALVQADLDGIQNITFEKQSIVEDIHKLELLRLKYAGELALYWKKPIQSLTLPNIILLLQDVDVKSSEQMRSSYSVLTLLVQRILDQNQANQQFVELSLGHIQQMRKNLLGEGAQTTTYTQSGHKSSAASSSRLISKEA